MSRARTTVSQSVLEDLEFIRTLNENLTKGTRVLFIRRRQEDGTYHIKVVRGSLDADIFVPDERLQGNTIQVYGYLVDEVIKADQKLQANVVLALVREEIRRERETVQRELETIRLSARAADWTMTKADVAMTVLGLSVIQQLVSDVERLKAPKWYHRAWRRVVRVWRYLNTPLEDL